MESDELAIYAWINPAKPGEVVKHGRHRMVAWLAVRYGVHHELDDIWQEWQLAVFRRAQTGTPLAVEQREAFSFGIARNLCRRSVREGGRLTPLDPTSPPTAPRAGSGRRQPGDDVEDCIKRLRPGVQRILVETYWEGKSGLEVARETGLSADNVRQQLHRARGELRRCMEARAKRPERKEWQNAGFNRR